MTKEKKYVNTIGEKINKTINIINKEKEYKMLATLRKIVEDLNKLDMLLASMELTPQQNFELHQLVNNNRIRCRKVIWEITQYRITEKDLE